MNPDRNFSPSGRPDLDEFLLTLGGFLEQKTSPGHPDNLRFLSTFCRSIGAGEGHLLQLSSDGNLNSMASVGLGNDFDAEFNSLRAKNPAFPSPPDEALRHKEVIAIVDLEKEKSLAPWFKDLMEKHELKSMVAVPLLGSENPVGVITAYYDDVCLFDQTTLHHLTMVGRMIGSAMDRQNGANGSEASSPLWRIVDEFLRDVATKVREKAPIYQLLAESAGRGLAVGGVIAGPVQGAQNNLVIKITGSYGISPTETHQVHKLPDFLEKKLKQEDFEGDAGIVEAGVWGSLNHLVGEGGVKYLFYPLVLRRKRIGAIIGWVPLEKDLSKDMGAFFSRLSQIASIALANC